MNNSLSARLDRRLATYHPGRVTQHENTDKWIAVLVPTNNRIPLFLGDSLVIKSLSWDGDIDMSNFVVNVVNEVDAGNL